MPGAVAPNATLIRPLLVRFGALGDLVTLSTCAEALRWRWGAPCDLITGNYGAGQVYAGLDTIADIVTLASRRTPYPASSEQWRLVRWLRRRGRTPVYLFEGKLMEVAEKLTWLLERGGLRREDMIGPRDVARGDLEHFHAYGMRLAAATPPAWEARAPMPIQTDLSPRLAISDEERQDCADWLDRHGLAGHPLVLLQPHSRRRNRGRWPAERWSELARAVLAELPAARVLVLGSRKEQRESAALAGMIADRRARSPEDLPLRRLFALLERAHSMISLDTGPAHAAATLGCPVVILVGIADPRRNRPVGPDSRIALVTEWPREQWPATRRLWETTHDVTHLPVDAVLAAWRGLATSP